MTEMTDEELLQQLGETYHAQRLFRIWILSTACVVGVVIFFFPNIGAPAGMFSLACIRLWLADPSPKNAYREEALEEAETHTIREELP
jgi:hypothetical protein